MHQQRQAVLNKVTSHNVLGIFCSNEATIKGLLAATNDGAALKSNAALRDVVVVGFDAGEAQKNAVRNSICSVRSLRIRI